MRVSHLRSATPTESPSIRRIPLTPASRAARRPPVSQAAGSSDANDSPSPIRVGPPTTENPFAGHKRCHSGPCATRAVFGPDSDSAACGQGANLSSVPKDDPGLNISPRFPCLPSLPCSDLLALPILSNFHFLRHYNSHSHFRKCHFGIGSKCVAS